MRLAPVVVVCVVAAACGGSVVFTEDDDGAGGSATTSATSSKSVSASTSKSGSGSSSSGATACGELSFGECVSNPACAPIFDDSCCPQCSPGPCADCVDWDFIKCLPRNAACNGDFDCGFVGEYVCQNTFPNCSGFCEGTMGCEPGVCSLGGPQCQACVPIVPGVCGSQCDSPPPPCPPGFVPASDGFCWTGLCIDGAVCGVFPPP